MAEFNLNMLFDKLTNFKIKFTEDEDKTPTLTQVSNMKVVFVDERVGKLYSFKDIRLNMEEDTVEIILESGMVREQ